MRSAYGRKTCNKCDCFIIPPRAWVGVRNWAQLDQQRQNGSTGERNREKGVKCSKGRISEIFSSSQWPGVKKLGWCKQREKVTPMRFCFKFAFKQFFRYYAWKFIYDLYIYFCKFCLYFIKAFFFAINKKLERFINL